MNTYESNPASQTEKTLFLHLYPEGSPDSAYHVENLPGELQREHLVDFNVGTEFHVQVDVALIAHGTLKPGGDLATLIALRHAFIAPPARQYSGVTIEYTFSPCHQTSPTGGSLEVFTIIPKGQININPTKYTKTRTLQSTLNFDFGSSGLGAVHMPSFASVQGTVRRHTEIAQEVQSKGTIQGMITFGDRKVGKKNKVLWVLAENPDCPGVSPTFDTVILVKRNTDEPFQAKIKVEARGDRRHWAVCQALRSRDRVDPLLLHPSLPPQGILLGEPELAIDTTNLSLWPGIIRLEQLFSEV